MTNETERSNSVIRIWVNPDDGLKYDILACKECGQKFERLRKRGVKPFLCAICTGSSNDSRNTSSKGFSETSSKGSSETSSKESSETFKGQHPMFGTLVNMLKVAMTSGLPLQPFLYGPAGTGKTHGMRSAADHLGLTCRVTTGSEGQLETDYFGYMDANSKYVTTAFRETWENGGLFLMDEFDATSPYVQQRLGTALASNAGETIEFPDGPVPRHPNCILAGAGNTNLRGATNDFVTRQSSDASIPTRFAFIEWGIDEEFERSLVSPEYVYWVKRVQNLRRAVKSSGAEGIYPGARAMIYGEAMLKAGMSQTYVEDSLIWQGCDPAAIRTVLAAL